MHRRFIVFSAFILINFTIFSSDSRSLTIPGLSILRDLGVSALSGVSNFVFPKKDLDDQTGDRLRDAILKKNIKDIKFIADNYEIAVFNTIQEIRSRESERTYRFDTPLRLALYFSNKDVFSLVLQSAKDPNAKLRTFKHILNDAVQLKNIECVRILLEANGLHINGDKGSGEGQFSPMSDAIVIEGDLRNKQIELLEKMKTGSDSDTAIIKERLDRVSIELDRIRQVIGLLTVRGVQSYTPRTNGRLKEQAKALIQKKQEERKVQ
jgi:hypothetical protein